MNIEEHNTPVVENAINETLKELQKQADAGTAEAERLSILLNYFFDRGSTDSLKYLSINTKDILPNRSNFSGTELPEESVSKARPEDLLNNEMVRALRNKKIYRQTYYRKAYHGLRDTEIHKGWIDLLTEIYEEDMALNEIFIRLVEEQRKTAITSPAALQEITGITRLGFDKHNEKEEARRQMKRVFTSAMQYRYGMVLEEMLSAGKKYNDLMKTDPAKYYLSVSYKDDAIVEAIYNFFEMGDFTLRKDLKDIANTIEAPVEIVRRAGETLQVS
jgi:hypothetical protein